MKNKIKLKEDETVLGVKGPIPLSKIPKDAAAAAIDAGHNDNDQKDDTAQFKKASIPASKLRASQTEDRKSTRLNSSHIPLSRMPSSA